MATSHPSFCRRDLVPNGASLSSYPTLMVLARHRDYPTTQRDLRLDGDDLKLAVERMASSKMTSEPVIVSEAA